MKVVVYGSSGFIGSHLTERLKQLNHEVIEAHHDKPFIPTEADYIFYLSSYGNHYTQNDKYQTIKANILDLYSLLKSTRNIPYKAFIHFSTSSVILPVQTLYSDSKFVAELICKRFARKYNKNVLSVRPYSVYGPGEAKFRFIPTAMQRVKEGKLLKLTQGYHDWIYIDDFIDALISVMTNADMFIGKSVSIGTGLQYSNFEVVTILEEIIKKKANWKYSSDVKRIYDNNHWVSDNTLVSLTGWKPSTGITKGLMKCCLTAFEGETEVDE